MSKVEKRQKDEEDVEEEEELEEVEEDAASLYDDEDIDDDMKRDDDDEEDDESEVVLPKKRHHIYHQEQESTEIRIVPANRRITSEYMTIYEYSMVVGTRATHIASGSVLYTDPDGLYDPRDIAKKEIAENKCPLSITRKVSPTMIEIWEVNEMVKPQM